MLLEQQVGTYHRVQSQVVRLRVGHDAPSERAGTAEATLQAGGRAEGAHAGCVPAAVHVRVGRMQPTGQVAVLTCGGNDSN